MNRANLDRLIAAMEALERHGKERRFRMKFYYVDPDGDEHFRLSRVPPELSTPDPAACGTAACLAGWCQLLGAVTAGQKDEDATSFAQDWLGLDEDEASDLFLGYWGNDEQLELDDITLPQALDYLRQLRVANAAP